MSILGAAPWRRAPLLLARTPGVFLACTIAMAVLAMAGSSGVLFLASTGTAALHNEAAQECPESAQPGVTDDPGPSRLPGAANTAAGLGRGDVAVRSALATAGLPAADLVAQSTQPIGGTQTDVVTLFARAGAVDHVHLISSVPGHGVVVPRSFARARGLGSGSHLTVGAGTVRVVGVYRDLAPSAFAPLFALPRYWCTWRSELVPTPFDRPPPVLLTDVATLEHTTGSRTSTPITATWYVPTRIDRQTVPQARAALAATTKALALLNGRAPGTYEPVTDLTYLLAKAERERSGLGGAVVPIGLAGTLVAAMLVAAAGAFWGIRRQREVRLLAARGVGPAAIGLKAALEMAPALLLGTVLGWLAALELVARLGPSALFEPGAPWRALQLAGVTAVGGLVTVGCLGARASRSESMAVRRGRRRWSRAPWELALLGAAVLVYHDVRRDGAVHIVKATVQINPLVLAFPLLALTGAVLLLARVGLTGLARMRTVATRFPTAAYLAIRRLGGTPAVALGTLIGVAVPVGVLLYSAALSGSTSADLQRKYETNVGAPHAVGTLARPGSTPDLRGSGTVVSRIQTGVVLADGEQAAVIGVDPGTFADFAFGGAALRPALSRLGATGPRVDALLVNAAPGTRVTSLRISTTNQEATIAIDVVGTAASFPGERNPYQPLLVVNRRALPAHLPPLTDRSEEVWTSTTSLVAALAALRSDGVDPKYEITPTTFLDDTGLRPVTWIFDYLRALAYLTGLVAVTALAFAFTAGTRRRALSYYMARRMGLGRAEHRRSIALELGGLLALSWAVGVGLAAGAVALVYRLTDAYPTFPPPPTYPFPLGTVGASAFVAVVVAVSGTYLLQHLLDRIRPTELLRTA